MYRMVNGPTILDRVDAADRPVGTVPRQAALRPGVGFRVVHVLIVNEAGEIALQEIGSSHPRHPGWWGSSVAGYVRSGESYEMAAKRKLSEEVGLHDHPIEFLGKLRMQDEGATKLVAVFLARASRAALKPNPKDFQSIAFAPLSILRSEIQRKTRIFTPTFVSVMQFAAPLLDARLP